ncbi:4-hydroxyphenylacetate 3-hydroxylase family protein [Phenylobacterium immobile]|uniref:4-hydroxyphenylacetate 3-hydroxylase family protein n=1 Tax=Phenylobacterium immobile TaxID=21 RepID=UPI000A8F341C|nr:4-hydroxyphenylacetate 3-hydroxylase N-terminal domain-containing protein [Phenylobacterium immobile]
MGARTGQQYLESMRVNQPEVWLNGERVEDITTHPVFVGPIKSIMEQYDLQHHPDFRDICLYESPTTGDLVSTGFMTPKSREDIIKRRRHFKARADLNFGTMGRAPDFMNALVTMWQFSDEHYSAAQPKYAGNAKRYYEKCREEDLYLTHVLVNPQIDRSRTSANQEDPFLHLGRVGETEEGIIVRGAKMLGTMAALTEEMLVQPFGGVAPGDDAYALVFSIPSNAPGMKFICRESFSPGGRTLFDHPLSSRFEEMDCVAIFDDVLIPWDRIVVDGSPGSGDIVNGAGMDPRAAVNIQTASRNLACMELLCGTAVRVADAVGITGFLHIQEKLGFMLQHLEMVKAQFYGSDAMAVERPDGYWVSYGAGLAAVHMQAGALHAQFVEIINTLAGGGYFYAPSKGDFDNPELRGYIDKYVRGRPGVTAEDRVKLFKLAWDLSGEAFGQRLRQYIKFFSGDPVRNTAGFYLNYDKTELYATIDRVLAGPGADMPVPPATPQPPARRERNKAMTLSYPAASHPVQNAKAPAPATA